MIPLCSNRMIDDPNRRRGFSFSRAGHNNHGFIKVGPSEKLTAKHAKFAKIIAVFFVLFASFAVRSFAGHYFKKALS